VNEIDRDRAEAAAGALMEKEGWDIVELDEAYPVELSRYPAGHPSRDSFEQAKVGIVATFHGWPMGAPEDE
jgi:hypothetical protein